MTRDALTTTDWMTVVGARPQFIKSAALTRLLAPSGMTQHLVHSGQHPDDGMGLDFLVELGVPPPDVRIKPAQENRTTRMADMMRGIADEIVRRRPRAVIVYGDTDSTLAGALAAHHAGVPLVHIEAGLRSGDRSMPEEHNRIMTDQLSDLLFTTGPEATERLIAEGVAPSRIVEVGDVMLDVALASREIAGDHRPPGWPDGTGPILVATLHRPGLVDDPGLLEGAMEALGRWCSETGGHVYFPVHPRTAASLDRYGIGRPAGMRDPGPIGYLDMQAALMQADGVLTDSGGLQKEAWYQGTPSVVLRDTTEWGELLRIGASSLYDPEQLRKLQGRRDLVERLNDMPAAPAVRGSGLLGEGRAAHRIVEALQERF